MVTVKHKNLIQLLTERIHDSSFELVSVHETRANASLTEGEWLARTDIFIKDPNNNIPGGAMAKELTVALLSKSYANHLNTTTLKKLIKPLAEPTKKTAVKKTTPTQLRKAQAKILKLVKT